MYLMESDVTTFFVHAYVNDLGSGSLEAVTHSLDVCNEVRARVVVRDLDYKILHAEVARMRTPSGKRGAQTTVLDELHGALAYEGVGATAKRAIGDDPQGLALSAILECIKVLRQARLFVWNRLGIDPADHIDLIARMLQDSCIFYAEPQALSYVLKPDQLLQMSRWDCLFSRHKSCVIQGQGDATSVEARLIDSYHEMALTLNLQEDFIQEAVGQMLRLPHIECEGALDSVERLVGQELGAGPKSWEGALIGREGCAHMSDLARFSWESIVRSRTIQDHISDTGERAIS